ncbi:MAG: hypothetical protein U0Q11_10060 [Vicinamibacterales bacterium]
MLDGLLNRFTPPALTTTRVRSAYGVAIATDVLQFILGPFGWVGADELLDVIAAAITYRLLGFHPLLLPTFMLEFLPVTDMLPTWTACVALVISTRRSRAAADEPPPPEPGQVIDVKDFRST